MRKFLALFTVIITLFSSLATTAWAHDMPSSAVTLDFEGDRVTAELVLPLDRLEVAFGQTLMDSPTETVNRYGDSLEVYILEHVRLVSPTGADWSVAVSGMSLQLETEPYDLVVQLTLTPPNGAPLDRFDFRYDVIVHQLVTHSTVVSIRNDWNHAVTASQPVLLGTIRANVTSLEVDRSGGSWWTGFVNLVQLGISHIAEGTDHLMFLLVLLLPAPMVAKAKRWAEFGGVRHSLVQLLKITTAFTVGHSLTLIIGALEWIPGSSRWVETLIAVSILVSAVHAIRPLFPKREAVVAFGFGLIHGMAFATLIGAIGLSPWRMASSILGFNVGIELMQLAVIVAAVPWLLLLTVTPLYRHVRRFGAALAIVASIAWIAERLTQSSNAVASAVNAATPYAGWLIVVLAAIALAATGRRIIARISMGNSSRENEPTF